MENRHVNKPFFRRAGAKKQAPKNHQVKVEDVVVQTMRSDEISEFSNSSAPPFIQTGFLYSDDEDTDDDISSRVESVVAAAEKIKQRMGKQQSTKVKRTKVVENTRRPLQNMQKELVKPPPLAENKELHKLHSSLLPSKFGDDTSNEIQALVEQANLLAPTQQQGKTNEEESVMFLKNELTKQSAFLRSLTKQISLLENLLCEKDQELEDNRYYNEMNDRANKKLLIYSDEKYDKVVKENEERVSNLMKIIQRQLLGETEFATSLMREKNLLEKELAALTMHLNEEAMLDKQHLKRAQCAVVVAAIVSAYVALVIGLESFPFLYTAPFYFMFVFFVIA